VKLGIRVSPRTFRRYMPWRPTPRPTRASQAWSTFVRNHARSMLACDFFVAVTATFRVVYVFVVMEVGTRRIVHWNVTAHPSAEWTAQQFRMIVCMANCKFSSISWVSGGCALVSRRVISTEGAATRKRAVFVPFGGRNGPQ
jgi:hypothetical protein